MSTSKKELNEDLIKLIEWDIVRIERQNVKSHEKKDADMVNDIIEIIKREVDRSER